MKKAVLLLGLVLGLLAVPRQASAQWAVFDASNLAMMSKIWSQDISNYAKLVQEVEQATRIATSAMQIYGVAMQEASFLKNKQLFQALGYAAMNAQIPGHPDWDKAIGSAGGMGMAGQAWQQMTRPGMGFQNRLNLADSFGASMLNALGNCYTTAQSQNGALSMLESAAISLDPMANTRANQSNITNMGITQQLRLQECQHNLQMNQAKIQMLRALQERDRDQQVYDMRTADSLNRGTITSGDTAQSIARIQDR